MDQLNTQEYVYAVTNITSSNRPQISKVDLKRKIDNVNLNNGDYQSANYSMEEVMFIQPKHKSSFVLYFENNPVWLLSLEPRWTHQVYVPNFDSANTLILFLAQREFSTKLIENSIKRMGENRLIFGKEMTNCIQLISGSKQFVSNHVYKCESTGQQAIGVLDFSCPKRLRNGRPAGLESSEIVWHRIRHLSVGGTSEYISLFALVNINVSPLMSSLRRVLAHVIDYGIRPAYVKGPTTLSNCLSTNERIDPNNLSQVVVYGTHFYGSGWGSRSLEGRELHNVFGLSMILFREDLGTRDYLHVVPIQLLQSVLNTTLMNSHILPNQIDVIAPRKLASYPSDKSWIPALSVWLSHKWIDMSTVTDKAAKRDDALVPTQLWDQRITLLFPTIQQRHLNIFRTFFVRVARRRLFKSFSFYVGSTYGANWTVQLSTLRGSFRDTGGKRKLHLHNFHLNSKRKKYKAASDDLNDRFINHELTSNEMVNNKLLSNKLVVECDRGVESLRSLANSNWWEWSGGSSLHFWRWSSSHDLACIGSPPYIISTLPRFRKVNNKPSEKMRLLIAPKLQSIIDRGYVSTGKVNSLIKFFAVPKLDDVRLVYNGSSCGLNACVWVPSFWLPTAATAIRVLDFNYYAVDLDIGEMFLNFPLHPSLQEVSGIDVSPYFQDLTGLKNSNWLHWTRTWMGARSSPFCAVQMYYLAEEFVKGNHSDRDNVFYWDEIRLNLPGCKGYDPSLPRIMKWDIKNNWIAPDLVVFVDDLRGTGPTIEVTWKLSRVVASRLQYLGIQDASRKRRPPTQSPGAWAGGIFKTTQNKIICTVTSEKWLKGKQLIENLWILLNPMDLPVDDLQDRQFETTFIPFKTVEIARGFLVHLSMTFECMRHHLKGFHLVLAAHNTKRDIEGWKMSDVEWKKYVSSKVSESKLLDEELISYIEELNGNVYDPKSYPPFIPILPHFIMDVFAFREFFEEEKPPEMEVRNKNVGMLLYGFADASGTGFGSMIDIPGSGLRCRVGIWGKDSETNSSNYKEFENVVLAIEEEGRKGSLQGSTLYLFTDNSTVESGLYKGNTPNKRLFSLIVRLRKCEISNGAKIIVSHVSGKRMIAQGTDGVSRGLLNEGVASGIDMLSFIPLHLNAFDRSSSLKAWVSSWAGNTLQYLSEEDWFVKGHSLTSTVKDKDGFWRHRIENGKFIWAPPPAAADVAIEELRKALIKRHKSTHIFICPRLLTTEWRRQLNKACDLVVFIKPCIEAWPSEMFEPLTLGFVFPFLPFHPWQIRGTPKMLNLARTMPGLLSESNLVARNILFEFLEQMGKLPTMHEDVVRRVLYYAPRS